MPSNAIEIILLVVIAGVLLFKLRSVLGTKTGLENPSDYIAPPHQNTANVHALNRDIPAPPAEPDFSDVYKYADKDSVLANVLIRIRKVDPALDMDEFMTGARGAFEMLLMAFEAGDRKLLSNYTSPEVYESFVAAIEDREAKKLRDRKSVV